MTTFLGKLILEDSPFPDGQPHLVDNAVGFAGSEAVTCRIACADDLLRLALLVSVRRRRREPVKHLRILYLMGGRMDRSLSAREPYTLRVVCDLINSLKIPRVSVFCPHSSATHDLLDRSDADFYQSIETSFYDLAALNFLASQTEEFRGVERVNIRDTDQLSFVFPDLGAQKRFAKSPLLSWWPNANLVVLHKDRDERSGQILGTRIISGEPRKYCLIVDDLCDGGATFVHGATVLRERHLLPAPGSNGTYGTYTNAEKIGLAVCHGIFSKGLPLQGIDFVATTNSFRDHELQDNLWVQRFV